MILLDNVEVVGWKPAIRGMRNPMNSWDKSDSRFECETGYFKGCKWDVPDIGPNDLDLMKRLRDAGTDHRKYMRMIVVYCDITAPLYWWKEFDTYRQGVEKNSCSTMHKIHAKEFTPDDFSNDHLMESLPIGGVCLHRFLDALKYTVMELNIARRLYLETKDKKFWNVLIQLLPTSYNQKRTVMMSYEALANMYNARKGHKLDEWREMCKWMESLPYSCLITGKEGEPCG